ncbi:hypothetical protein BKG93_10465 [Rodentibacter ratti]|uniref:Sel1 repeat family protein n=1 Tax=Rodentibacter ratti TaxID=1906745 RepID=A0A1V3L0E7_9PAST|nr:hypothetical protein [Rodentibacter ratti]OOF83315.1 hypothetical protein BKG93_10465 [Rodentibacter ratti]
MMKTFNSLKAFFVVFAFCSFSAIAQTADELFKQAEDIISNKAYIISISIPEGGDREIFYEMLRLYEQAFVLYQKADEKGHGKTKEEELKAKSRLLFFKRTEGKCFHSPIMESYRKEIMDSMYSDIKAELLYDEGFDYEGGFCTMKNLGAAIMRYEESCYFGGKEHLSCVMADDLKGKKARVYRKKCELGDSSACMIYSSIYQKYDK